MYKIKKVYIPPKGQETLSLWSLGPFLSPCCTALHPSSPSVDVPLWEVALIMTWNPGVTMLVFMVL